MKSWIAALLVALALPTLAAAQAADESDFLAARELSAAARKGDTSATPRAFEAFERLTKAHPDQPLYRAYYGSTYCLKGRDAWFPFTKLAHVESGMAEMDKALRQLGPEHDTATLGHVAVSLETRLVVASTMFGLPATFNRRQQSRDVMADLLASPALAASPAGFQAAVHLQAGKMARQRDAAAEAQAELGKAVALAPESDAGKAAQALLTAPKN